MKSGRACGWRLALLFGVALATLSPTCLPAAPEEAPPDYVWADCKGCRARMLRPAFWLSKEDAVGCHFSPEAFPASGWLDKGVIFFASPAKQREIGQTADECAVAGIAKMAAQHRVHRGSTRVGQPPGPFTAYSLTYDLDRSSDGKEFVYTEVFIVNRKTDTLYTWVMKSPRDQWREVEAFESTMLKSLQLDPEF